MNEIKDIVAGAWLIFRRSLCSINASRSMIFISGAFLLLMAGVIASVSAKGMWSMKNYRPGSLKECQSSELPWFLMVLVEW